MYIFLPPAFRRNGEGTVFIGICLSTFWSGYSIWPMGVPHPVLTERYPLLGLDGVPLFGTGWGYPLLLSGMDWGTSHWDQGILLPIRTGSGLPHIRTRLGYSLPCQDWMGEDLPIRTGFWYPPLRLDGVTALPSGLDGGALPPPRHPSRDIAAERALATRRAVCLFRSSRRTFLCRNAINCF